jgi:hypothetical protein
MARPNNALERTEDHRGPRLAAARSPCRPLNSVVRRQVPKLTCPHCNQRAMSIWRKMNTHFAWPGKCANCEGLIGIPSCSFHAWLARSMLFQSCIVTN